MMIGLYSTTPSGRVLAGLSRDWPMVVWAQRRSALMAERRPGPRTKPTGTQRTHELSVLNAIAEALNSAVDVQQALEQTLGLVADLLGLRTGWVWLIDPASGQFYNAAAQQLPPYLQEPVRMTGRSCWCIVAFNDGELSARNVDVLECSRLRPAVQANEVDLTQELRYHASVPLYFRDKPLGIMNLTGPAWRKLSRAELRLLSTNGYQVGTAI
jgi:two-component system NarL family sensor kinase